MNKLREKSMGCVFLVTALASIFAVIIICLFLFANGLPTIAEIGPFDFLLGTTWKPTNDIYGIFPMILGSIYVTAGSLIIGVPVGLLCAVYLARFCPAHIYKYLKPAVDLLAGIPSIVYGFFGLVVIVPIMREMFGGNGKSVLTASILLGIMILPTLISVGEASIRAVPESYYEDLSAFQPRFYPHRSYQARPCRPRRPAPASRLSGGNRNLICRRHDRRSRRDPALLVCLYAISPADQHLDCQGVSDPRG